MTNTWLDRIEHASPHYESPRDFVDGECLTINDAVEMARELLCFFGDYEHDEMFADMLTRMVRDYLDEVV